jgi:hypothetical protein
MVFLKENDDVMLGTYYAVCGICLIFLGVLLEISMTFCLRKISGEFILIRIGSAMAFGVLSVTVT